MKAIRLMSIAAALTIAASPAWSQAKRAKEFSEVIAKMDTLMAEHTGAKSHLALLKVMARGEALDFYFTESLADFPIRKDDAKWLRETLQENMPEHYKNFKIGNIYCKTQQVNDLIVDRPGNDGQPGSTRHRMDDNRGRGLVERGINAPKGLSGRHIAIWQSHGNYYHLASRTWKWQRACMFQTVEDLYTQSYVVPFLTPMLENAGANVFLPRERDWHTSEIIIDNDPCESESGRQHGSVEFTRKWQNAGFGFADSRPLYRDGMNPFLMGTAMKMDCTSKREREAKAVWSSVIPEDGEYAVYVSYVSLPKSSAKAHYIVHSLGGDKDVYVDQRMGGGTWVYIGNYEFGSGFDKRVTLSNLSKDGAVVSADAVKIGGGMGNIERAPLDSTCFTTSGRPRFAEGSRYFMQWSGVPEKVWSQNEGKEDYRDDFMSRGTWVKYLSGGSRVNPGGEGLNIPIDLSLAFHTDAGTRPGEDIVGTLAIYTRLCDDSAKLPDGSSRDACREVTDFVQTQIVDDIRAQWDSTWTRRQLWNRSYSESRTTGVPGLLLELLSHQNFEDMKYGSDPAFRFCVARACYKGILKYLSLRYGCPYVVQPLPVTAFSASVDLESMNATLCWTPVRDTLELTADPTSYIVYTRVDDSGWDGGMAVKSPMAVMPVEKGHIYSYRVVAVNEGGLSFPSEILAVGTPDSSEAGKVLIVNNFHRISGPAWFDSPTYAGFDNRRDSGVPYVRDWSYIGEQYEFNRPVEYDGDDNAGFGACYDDYADIVIGGNNFDYPYMHGKSVIKAGYAFDSCSSDAFGANPALAENHCAMDLICGKECRVRTSNFSPVRGGVFPEQLRDAIRHASREGCGILISGSYIALDSFGTVYPIEFAKDERKSEQNFLRTVLGYTLRRSYASRTGDVSSLDGTAGTVQFPVRPCPQSYCVESPDALAAYGIGSRVYMTYTDSNLPAGIRVDKGQYRVAAFGFPIETVTSEKGRDALISQSLEYLVKK